MQATLHLQAKRLFLSEPPESFCKSLKDKGNVKFSLSIPNQFLGESGSIEVGHVPFQQYSSMTCNIFLNVTSRDIYLGNLHPQDLLIYLFDQLSSPTFDYLFYIFLSIDTQLFVFFLSCRDLLCEHLCSPLQITVFDFCLLKIEGKYHI